MALIGFSMKSSYIITRLIGFSVNYKANMLFREISLFNAGGVITIFLHKTCKNIVYVCLISKLYTEIHHYYSRKLGQPSFNHVSEP